MSDRWATFDCYGALIDWERGIGDTLAALSNTDQDLLDASLERIGVPVDGRITAAEAGSYKPAPGHWERFFEQYDSDPEHYVHVGASPYHDLEPAERLGLPAVWINRLRESSDAARAGE